MLLLPLGYEVALGGFIMCGVLFCLVSFIVKKAGTGWLDVLFPPAAMGAIVAVIGLELAGVAAGMAGLLPAEGQTPDSKTIIIYYHPGGHGFRFRAVSWFPGNYPDFNWRAGGVRALFPQWELSIPRRLLMLTGLRCQPSIRRASSGLPF